jgi:hypothetical protein
MDTTTDRYGVTTTLDLARESYLVSVTRGPAAHELNSRNWTAACTIALAADVLVVSLRVRYSGSALMDAHAHAWQLIEDTQDSFWARHDRIVICATSIGGMRTHLMRGGDAERTARTEALVNYVMGLQDRSIMDVEDVVAGLVDVCEKHKLQPAAWDVGVRVSAA